MLVKAAGQGTKSNHGSPFYFACATAPKSHRSANAKGRIWVCGGFLPEEWGLPAGSAAPSLPGRSESCSPGSRQLVFIPATTPRYRPCSCTPQKAGDCSGHCYHCHHNSNDGSFAHRNQPFQLQIPATSNSQPCFSQGTQHFLLKGCTVSLQMLAQKTMPLK